MTMKKIPIEELANMPLSEENQKGEKVLTIGDLLLKIRWILSQGHPIK